MNFFSPDLMWWVTVIDIPALAGLFWLFWTGRQSTEQELDRLYQLIEKRHAQMRESLSAYKLEAAKTYAGVHDVREIETRLINHLLRIEHKLDSTALKAASLSPVHISNGETNS